MRIAIVGPGKSGKTTASQWLAEHTPLRYAGSTSAAAANVVCSHATMRGRYATLEECYADRRNRRQEWRDIILQYNQPDGLRLYRDMVRKSDILDGIRDGRELQACRDAGLADVVVWMQRDVPTDPSMGFGPEVADRVINNDGSFEELYAQLRELGERLGLEINRPGTSS
jgi:hypothetical protein